MSEDFKMIHLFKRNMFFARRFLCSVLLLSVCNTSHLTSVVFADEESARKAAAEGNPGAEIWKNTAFLGVFTAGETRSFQGMFLDKHHILTSSIPIWEHKKQNGTCVITVMVKKSRNSLDAVQRVLDQAIFFSDYTQKKCSKETYFFADPTVAEDARENKLFASAHGVFKRYAGARVCGDRFRKVIGPSICILKLNEGVDYMQDLWPLLGFFQEPAKPEMPESLQASAVPKAKEKFLWSELGAKNMQVSGAQKILPL